MHVCTWGQVNCLITYNCSIDAVITIVCQANGLLYMHACVHMYTCACKHGTCTHVTSMIDLINQGYNIDVSVECSTSSTDHEWMQIYSKDSTLFDVMTFDHA